MDILQELTLARQTEDLILTLPHPSTELGMNGRGHWSKRYKLAKELKKDIEKRLLLKGKPHNFTTPSRYRIAEATVDEILHAFKTLSTGRVQ